MCRRKVAPKSENGPPSSYSVTAPSNIIPSMFSDVILAHFRNPHNAGDLPGASSIVEVTNPVCGDILRLSVRVDNGIISAARFKTQGCVAAIASSSMLTVMLIGEITCGNSWHHRGSNLRRARRIARRYVPCGSSVRRRRRGDIVETFLAFRLEHFF